MGYKNNDLKKGAKFALFVSSYLPLFILVILRQLSDNYNYLHWGGISINSIKIFLSFFGLSSVLTLVSILGIIGLYNTLKNIEDISENDIDLTLKMLADYYKKGEVSGKAYGTYAGKEIKEVKPIEK